jgi:glucoamylase
VGFEDGKKTSKTHLNRSRTFSVLLSNMLWSLLTVFVAISSVFAQSADSYVATELPIAKAGLVANIGPNGSKAAGAKSGLVVASPSKSNPDYFYTWTRDSALVFQTIIDL